MKKIIGYLGVAIAILGVMVLGAEPQGQTAWYTPFLIGLPMLIIGAIVAFLCFREDKKKPLPRDYAQQSFSAIRDRRWGR